MVPTAGSNLEASKWLSCQQIHSARWRIPNDSVILVDDPAIISDSSIFSCVSYHVDDANYWEIWAYRDRAMAPLCHGWSLLLVIGRDPWTVGWLTNDFGRTMLGSIIKPLLCPGSQFFLAIVVCHPNFHWPSCTSYRSLAKTLICSGYMANYLTLKKTKN